MKDRFKFRVWLKDTNKMYNVHSLHIGTNKVIISSRHGNVSIYINKNTILMQSTGLKDKNGKLIYDGDIIVNEKFVKYITKWNDNIGQFYISKINPSKYDNWKDWHLARHDLDYEVIGNVYENPELPKE